jgi:hypothetical protein
VGIVNLRPTVSRPVCYGVRRPSGTRDQFFFLLEISFRQLQVCYFVAPSLTRGRQAVNLRPTVSRPVCPGVRTASKGCSPNKEEKPLDSLYAHYVKGTFADRGCLVVSATDPYCRIGTWKDNITMTFIRENVNP